MAGFVFSAVGCTWSFLGPSLSSCYTGCRHIQSQPASSSARVGSGQFTGYSYLSLVVIELPCILWTALKMSPLEDQNDSSSCLRATVLLPLLSMQQYLQMHLLSWMSHGLVCISVILPVSLLMWGTAMATGLSCSPVWGQQHLCKGYFPFQPLLLLELLLVAVV